MRRAARACAALVGIGLLTGALSACGDDLNTDTAPVEVEVGEAFSWNSFTVEDGWEINPIKRSAGVEEVTTPEVKGTITNRSEEERAALFEMVFSADGSPLATVSCSAATMVEDQSQQFVCPGLSATMPEGYDAVVVQEFSRDTTPS
ncbi:hypothetical protein GCM10011376_27640 [Nocardioides flavus (ex Wang et al. 2016)]|uniref:Lipoprotein n=1 Tax=Nocardioides flavus (ex Wang et al. 2016) TaxID=2058780 RepID=A0ABQ3HPR1_9ACTN|nr:hypothetical protein [Nocardioides flavus (ex Wang et al. 2016)]GHE18154.1 hypothetical protein GCM10011376_27640 [Nocardioides flavus (ex Wang et al. 2016)]